jgi:uncharacterized membrane protein
VSEWSVVLVAATWLLSPFLSDAESLALFNVVGVAHLLIFWVTLVASVHLSEAQLAELATLRRWPREGGQWASLAFAVLASLSGVLGALTAQFYRSTSSERGTQYLGALCVVIAWMLLHAGYTKFYAKLSESGDGPVLSVRTASGPPQLVDYAYFSFTIGTSFAVSDIVTTQQRTRLHVLGHSIVSFFYNSAILALAIGLVTGK